jgi:hypothetical protein
LAIVLGLFTLKAMSLDPTRPCISMNEEGGWVTGIYRIPSLQLFLPRDPTFFNLKAQEILLLTILGCFTRPSGPMMNPRTICTASASTTLPCFFTTMFPNRIVIDVYATCRVPLKNRGQVVDADIYFRVGPISVLRDSSVTCP